MISRRGARIKVFQVLYSMSRDQSLTPAETKRNYRQSVEKLYNLFLFGLYSIVKICQVAEEDEENRKTKYLPTDEDKHFDSRIYSNPIIQGLANNKTLYTKAEQLEFKSIASIDFARKVYTAFNKTAEYSAYVIKKDVKKEDHVKILLELFRFCRKSEYFLDVMEDGFSNWIDDKSLVIGAIKKVLKAAPKEDILKEHVPDDEIVEEFGIELLSYYMEEEDELIEQFKPVLENWDHDRLAVIDTILIQMALCEFLEFETIPVKVTINEYVELSKRYSTPKSKEFVNGILDKMLTELQKNNSIQKIGRGLKD